MVPPDFGTLLLLHLNRTKTLDQSHKTGRKPFFSGLCRRRPGGNKNVNVTKGQANEIITGSRGVSVLFFLGWEIPREAH